MLKLYLFDGGTKYVSIRERMVQVTTAEFMGFLEQHDCKNFRYSGTGKAYIEDSDEMVSYKVLDFWLDDLVGKDYVECIENWFCKGSANRDDEDV